MAAVTAAMQPCVVSDSSGSDSSDSDIGKRSGCCCCTGNCTAAQGALFGLGGGLAGLGVLNFLCSFAFTHETIGLWLVALVLWIGSCVLCGVGGCLGRSTEVVATAGGQEVRFMDARAGCTTARNAVFGLGGGLAGFGVLSFAASYVLTREVLSLWCAAISVWVMSCVLCCVGCCCLGGSTVVAVGPPQVVIAHPPAAGGATLLAQPVALAPVKTGAPPEPTAPDAAEV